MHIEKRSSSGRPIHVQFTTSALLVRELSIIFRTTDDQITAGLNIGAHKEAAEHFLSALNLQESTSGDTSEQLWFTLRRAFLSMVCFIFPLASIP